MKFLRLDFIPGSTDFALLVLRLWLGLSMLLLHGLDKAKGFATLSKNFPDPFGIGSPVSLGLVVFAEVVCSVLLVLGLLTRFAALASAINMGVAFFVAHKMALSGAGSGELAFLYLAGYVTLFFAGSGRFAIDGGIGRR